MAERARLENECPSNWIVSSNLTLSVIVVKLVIMSVEEYYSMLENPQRDICLELRSIIKKNYPTFKESMLWGVPVFNNGLIYIVALKDHTNLGFTVSNLTKEEELLFQGGGKTTRKIELRRIDEIDASKIKQLIDLVMSKS